MSLNNERRTGKQLFLSSIFFWWVYPILKLGSKRDLHVNDLYETLSQDESERLGFLLQREWNKELTQTAIKSNCGKTCLRNAPARNPSLTRALVRAFGMKYILLGMVPLLIECVVRLAQPVLLSQLIHYFNPSSEMSTQSAYLYATGVVSASCLYVLAINLFTYKCCHIGLQITIAIRSVIYKKSLNLSQESLTKTSIGHVVNLMSNDVGRFNMMVPFLHYLVIGPLQAIIGVVILYFYVVGPSCLIGLSVLVIFIPFQGWMGQLFSQLRLETAERTDERIKQTNEILNAIKVIKMYTWEKPFIKLIDTCRRFEVKVIRKTAIYRAVNEALYFISGKLMIFLTLAAYVTITENALIPDTAFLVVGIFYNIRVGITCLFPLAITLAGETLTSIQRIQAFLLMEDFQKPNYQLTDQIIDGIAEVNCEKLTAKWPRAEKLSLEDGHVTLSDISFNVKRCEVVIIVGNVGSGKSSLLSAILGELPALSGQIRVNGRISYSSQEPWIFTATIRQNILCGHDYNFERYTRVIKATALEEDFGFLPHGDNTMVGERGVILSGGQKARVNLARCLYVDADVYLMDDPLSAVDNHVRHHLFDEAINGFLRDKIRIVVTHQFQYLQKADKILVLKSGKVETCGSLSQLTNKGIGTSVISPIKTENHLKEIISNEANDKNNLIVEHNTERSQESEAFADEYTSSGKVNWKIYLKFFQAGGGLLSFVILCFTYVFSQIFFSASDYWLNIWTNAQQTKNGNGTIEPDSISWNSWYKQVDMHTGICVYSILVCCCTVFSITRAIHFFVYCTIASIKLHDKMFIGIIRSPLVFFDRNPIGRILNRFSRDIGGIDDVMPMQMYDFLILTLDMLGTLVTVTIINPWFLLPSFVLAFILYKLRNFYLAGGRSISRLEATTESPIFTHVSSSMIGITTIRTHQRCVIFNNKFHELQNVHTSACYLNLCTSTWYTITSEWIYFLYQACVIYTCTALRGYITSSEAGLAISLAMTLTGTVEHLMRTSVDVEKLMTSVERVVEYGEIPSEGSLKSTDDKLLQSSWPIHGNITFQNVFLRYKDNDQPVLKNINCFIRSGERVGIVGRTGAGKSSLIAALFRLTETDGRIVIDGVDTKTIGLHDLRSKISIIPQDPILFSGSLRKNLDPFNEYDDNILLRALDDVKFRDSAKKLQTRLDSLVSEGGSNLSVGEKQLICLARAILRKNKILILDEATANIDHKTGELIQGTVREKFKNCTVLTIAHRLNTVMDSDRIMVIDAGCLVEFDKPDSLLTNGESYFSRFVENSRM